MSSCSFSNVQFFTLTEKLTRRLGPSQLPKLDQHAFWDLLLSVSSCRDRSFAQCPHSGEAFGDLEATWEGGACWTEKETGTKAEATAGATACLAENKRNSHQDSTPKRID